MLTIGDHFRSIGALVPMISPEARLGDMVTRHRMHNALLVLRQNNTCVHRIVQLCMVNSGPEAPQQRRLTENFEMCLVTGSAASVVIRPTTS